MLVLLATGFFKKDLASNCCVTTCRYHNMSHVMRKPTFCICYNKDADQLRSNRGADQRLCFRYKDSTIPLLSKSKISRHYPFSFATQICLCLTWPETKTLVFSRRGSFIYRSRKQLTKITFFLRFQCKKNFL